MQTTPAPSPTSTTASPTASATTTRPPSPTATATSSPSGRQECPSRISIFFRSKVEKLTGRVRSPQPACRADRKVSIKEERSGSDRTVARTTTDGEGNWKKKFPRPNKGRFYAKVRGKGITVSGASVFCKSARSLSLVF
ncbi:MAG TPA: hypothetical protein VNC78_07585 [Actinomycetota bacterium]|nr:hypothetical protein [Actinomycetota bacterium]